VSRNARIAADEYFSIWIPAFRLEETVGAWSCLRGDTLRRPPAEAAFDYFRELLIEVNFALSLTPSPFTTEMIASEIPAAINPYSMAVAPDSLRKKRTNVFTVRLSKV